MDLRDLALAPSTIKAYTKQLNHFLTHTSTTLQDLPSLSDRRIDMLLSDFINHLFHSGAPFGYAAHTVGGLVHHLPHLRSKLFESHLRLRGWTRHRTTSSHPPLTWELTVVFAALMSAWGHHSESLGLLLSFDCYLRVGELTSLRKCDIIMRDDARLGRSHTKMALWLPKTKTGLNQWVTVNSDTVATLLETHIRTLPVSTELTDRVFPFSPSVLRKLIRRCSDFCGLAAPYVPHSLRHGGATRDFLCGVRIEDIMFRGRWKAMESAKRYIQTGRGLLAAQQVPQHINTLGIAIDDCLVSFMQLLRLSVPSVTKSSRLARPRRRHIRFDD